MYPVPINAKHNVTRMEDYCQLLNRGIEWDWMNFFANLWSEGDYKYSMGQIEQVWNLTPTPQKPVPSDPNYDENFRHWLDGKRWGELMTGVGKVFENNPDIQEWTDQFTDKGMAAGVAH